ncbi:TPA: hypothetical protein ACGTRQ_005105, partial [Vibrio parahaemolyticus]
VEQQSKAFHIWKAVGMAAKARTEALKDDMYFQDKSDADELTAKHVEKLVSGIDRQDDEYKLIAKLLTTASGGGDESELVPISENELKKWKTLNKLSSAFIHFAELGEVVSAKSVANFALEILSDADQSRSVAKMPHEIKA